MSEEKLEEFLLRFPGFKEIETQQPNMKELEGVVKIRGSAYSVRIECPNWPQMTQFHLRVEEMSNVQRFISECNGNPARFTLHELLERLPDLVVDEFAAHKPYAADSQQNFSAEISKLYAPQSYRIHINRAVSRVRFSNFLEFEQHYFEMILPSLLVVQSSLPNGAPWPEMMGHCTTISGVLRQFQKYLGDLRPFYECFSHIDELCHVVQPTKPTTKHNLRLFELRERVFLKLMIADPLAPLASMSVQIIGSTHEVDELRAAYSEGLLSWDVNLDVHKNLLRIFDLCFFPMPPDKDQPLAICNICLTNKLECDDVPIVSCDNPSCTLLFHPTCLKQWFKTLLSGREFLDVSFGECPFCKAKLSTSFAVMLDN